MNDPIFFVDSVNITRLELSAYQPTDIAVVTVYKDSNAIRLVGEQGKFGAVYIETKVFAKNIYWNYFRLKSNEYSKIFSTAQSDSSAIYVLNDSVLTSNFEGDLSLIDDKNFIELKIIDKQTLVSVYGIYDKLFGVIIRTKPKKK